MRLLFLALTLALAQTSALHAQTPFDMTPERPATENTEQQPAGQGRPADGGTAQPAVTTPVVAPAEAGVFKRYLLPNGNLDLNGEHENRAWSVYLTPQQAATGAELHVGYQNSIFVAPESSRLSIEINDTVIASEAVRSPDSVSQLRFAIPKNLLQPGSNVVRIRTSQRHRTDCTIESTYQLWSNIDAEKTYIAFDDQTAQTLQTLDDIRAIGVNGKGMTRFNFVVPALEQPGATVPLMRLAQGLAVFADMPNQSFSFSLRDLTVTAPGELTVLIGTPEEIQPLLPALPAGATTGPVAGFIEDPASRSPILVLSGPTWQAIRAAIESIVASTDLSSAVTRREVLATQRWRLPDAPLLFSDTTLRFSQLGVKTEQFSGRLFRTDFTIGAPADFYANAYGEAVIRLDAAYSAAVLPGSHIDVYVNGNIASTMPITSSGGGILRQLPINVTMRHFRPGVNTIAIETILQTEDDVVCAPGATGLETARFAIFDTSEFYMPDFARIAQRPNLAAAAGTGFPYGRSDSANPLFLDRVDADTLSAAATFLGQLAAASGHPIPVETVASPALIGNRSALFVGALSQMPQKLLAQMNIAEESRTAWGQDGGGQADAVNTEAALSEWSDRLRGGIWGVQIDAFEDWLKRNFDISLSTLRFSAAANTSFTPPNDASLLVAQSSSPDGSGTWSLVAAPSGEDLRDGMQVLSAKDNWQQLAGQITTYGRDTKSVETVPINAFSFVPTQPASLSNYRLIAANWLSSNILSYAVLLGGLGILLGLATAALLANLGRRE